MGKGLIVWVQLSPEDVAYLNTGGDRYLAWFSSYAPGNLVIVESTDSSTKDRPFCHHRNVPCEVAPDCPLSKAAEQRRRLLAGTGSNFPPGDQGGIV